mgnify:CR=1 FL=1
MIQLTDSFWIKPEEITAYQYETLPAGVKLEVWFSGGSKILWDDVARKAMFTLKEEVLTDGI